MSCTHTDDLAPTDGRLGPLPDADGCGDCLAVGGRWVHLRRCVACGHVGCCDSSPNRHATAHFHTTTHPLIQSFEPGEEWVWCYVDEVSMQFDLPPSPAHS